MRHPACADIGTIVASHVVDQIARRAWLMMAVTHDEDRSVGKRRFISSMRKLPDASPLKEWVIAREFSLGCRAAFEPNDVRVSDSVFALFPGQVVQNWAFRPVVIVAPTDQVANALLKRSQLPDLALDSIYVAFRYGPYVRAGASVISPQR